jgi:hypothetical protein
MDTIAPKIFAVAQSVCRLTMGWMMRNRSSSPVTVKNFHFTIPSRKALRPPIQWVEGALSLGAKAAGA